MIMIAAKNIKRGRPKQKIEQLLIDAYSLIPDGTINDKLPAIKKEVFNLIIKQSSKK